MSQAAAAPAFQMPRPLYEERGPIVLFGFIAMVFGMFMSILDIQIVASSISQIQSGLSASSDEVSWVQTSYLIAEVVMIPISGYLSRMMSTRILFSISAAGFTIASLLCGTANSIGEMMLYRAIQGFIGGAMIPTVFATSFLIFGPARRSASSAFVGLIVTMAPTIGPTLGGYITDLMGWHWLFFINVIPGIFVTITVFLIMDIDKPDWTLWKNLDVAGLIYLALFLGGFQYVLEEGARNDWFDDETVRVLAAVATISGVLFFWRTLTVKFPIVDLTPFSNPKFAVPTSMAFIIGIGLFGISFLLPLYLGRVRGFSSTETGEWLWVSGIFMFFTAPIAGRIANHVDLRYMAIVGFSMLASAAYLFTSLTTLSSYWDIFLPQALRGMGLMLSMLPMQSMAMQALTPAQIRGASGLFNLIRNTGGAFGLAMLTTQLSDRTNLHWERLREMLQPGANHVTDVLGGLAGRYADMMPNNHDQDMAALKILGDLTFQQASVMAFEDLFLLMAATFAITGIIVMFISKPINRLAQTAQPAEAH